MPGKRHWRQAGEFGANLRNGAAKGSPLARKKLVLTESRFDSGERDAAGDAVDKTFNEGAENRWREFDEYYDSAHKSTVRHFDAFDRST